MKRAPTTREEADETVVLLYGLTPEWLERVIERFGAEALTDEAFIWLAQEQHMMEMSR